MSDNTAIKLVNISKSFGDSSPKGRAKPLRPLAPPLGELSALAD